MAKMKTLTVGGQTYTVQDPEAVWFTSQTLTPQQMRQARENIGAADGALFEAQHGKNILPPDAESGYYDPSSAMTPIASEAHERTPKPIPVVGGKRLYLYTNGFDSDTTWLACAMFMDANMAFIVSQTRKVGMDDHFEAPSNATSMYLWIRNDSTPGIHMGDICLSYLPLDGYEAYFAQTLLRQTAVPKQTVWANAVDKVVDGYVRWDGNIAQLAGYKTAFATVEPDRRYRITAWNNTSVGVVAVFFDKNGNRIDANFNAGQSNGGVLHEIGSLSWYAYDGVEIDVPGNARTMLVTSGIAYCDPLVEKTVTMQDLIVVSERLSDQVENAVPLKGKTIVNFGDSIFGKRRPPEDISTELERLTGATVHNCGFGGCRMAMHPMTNYGAFSMYKLADAIVSGDWTEQDAAIADTTQAEAVPSYFSEGLAILKGLDFSEVDIVTIAYGTNDFTGGINLENADNAYDTNTFAGALRYSVEMLLTAYPHLKIFVCSQTYRFWMDASNVFTEDSDTKTNGNGVKLTDFVEKTEEVAKEYHLPYINNYDIGMNKFNRSQYFPATDGTHPLTTGCHLIAAHIAKKLF